ncbi:MAG: DUF2934 domain-containing protein [Candidatus Omnitrophica bacterium]|nr:DUF2934 domain-containing protein [Candidatus Omnitrophota bacterium]
MPFLKRKKTKVKVSAKIKAAVKKSAKIAAKKTIAKKPKLDEARLNQMIKERAYYIWEERQRPNGQDSDIWAQAEKDMHKNIK